MLSASNSAAADSMARYNFFVNCQRQRKRGVEGQRQQLGAACVKNMLRCSGGRLVFCVCSPYLIEIRIDDFQIWAGRTPHRGCYFLL